MKKTLNLIMLLLAATYFLSSCSKDEEPKVKENVIILDGTEYSISQAVTLEYGGSVDEGYNFDLYIGSSGLDFSEIDNTGISGKGNILYFELWSTSTTGLAAGTYTASSSFVPNTYTSSYIAINYDTATDEVDEEYDEVATGGITISVSGSTYTVTFDLTLPAGKKMTGNYTGAIPNF